MDNTEQFKTKQLVSVTKKPWYKQPLYVILFIFAIIVIIFLGLLFTGQIELNASDIYIASLFR
jgi:hypothetical protein